MIRPALLQDLTRGGSKVSKVRGKRVRSTKTETLKSSTVASQGRDERHCLVATACPGLSAPGAAALSIFEPITSARINRSSGPSQVRHITLGADLSNFSHARLPPPTQSWPTRQPRPIPLHQVGRHPSTHPRRSKGGGYQEKAERKHHL